MPKFYTNIDLNKNQLKNATVHNVPDSPSVPSNPAVGQIYFDTNSSSGTKNRIFVRNIANDTWLSIPYSGDIKNADIANSTIQVGKFDSSSVKLNTIAAPTGNVDLNSQNIVNVADPRSNYPQDAATKAYVDAAVSGLNVHAPAVVATTGTETYTASSGSITQISGTTIDTYSVQANDRILIKNAPASGTSGSGSTPETTSKLNGVYKVTSVSTDINVQRASDYDGSVPGEVTAGDYVLVLKGGQKGNAYTMTTTGSITVGTTAIEWTQFGQVTNYTAGNGLSLSGSNQFSIDTTITVDKSTAQTLTNKTFTDNTTYFQDQTTNSKKMQFELSGISASNTRTLTVQDSDGTIAITGNKLSAFASTSSSELAGVISDETGSGALVFATSPSLTTPSLGAATATTINGLTISSSTGTLTVANGKTLTASNTLTFTGTDSSSVAFGTGGTVTYTTNKLSVFAATSSSELAGVISDETGSGSLVFATSPSLTTPTIGVATATSVNKVAITAPSTSATLTLADGSTLATSGANSITLTSTGATNVTLPTSGTLARIYSTEIQATTTSAITVTHSLNTTNVVVQVYETSGTGTAATNLVYTDTAVTGVNTVTVTFGSADNLYYRVVVTG